MGLRTWLGLKAKKVNTDSGVDYPSIVEGLMQPHFPVDIVYTWVDSTDPEWQASIKQFRHIEGDARDDRFRSHEELRYSLRSIWAYAPWVNHIYIVTSGQVPSWLRMDNPQITIVPHSEILEAEYLPTFNAYTIESALHRIPGLAERYIYFNDDVLLLRGISPFHAFTGGGHGYAFLGRRDLSGQPENFVETNDYAHRGVMNSRALLTQKFGMALDSRLAHTMHPQRKSVAERCEVLFANAYHQSRQNRFRHPSDIATATYLHQSAGYLDGEFLLATPKAYYVKIQDSEAKARYDKLLARRDIQKAYTICLNDAVSSDGQPHVDYHLHLSRFLQRYYSRQSPFEVGISAA